MILGIRVEIQELLVHFHCAGHRYVQHATPSPTLATPRQRRTPNATGWCVHLKPRADHGQMLPQRCTPYYRSSSIFL